MEKYAGTQAIARCFSLLRLFDDARPQWSLVDLIAASGLKRTTVFRMMAALEAEGIVVKNARAEYQLGSELIMLGGRAIRSNHLRQLSRPFLEDLVFQTSESALLDVLWLGENRIAYSMVVEEALGKHVLGMAQYIGARYPAHVTSTGKVLLAFSSAERLANIDFGALEPLTQSSITDSEQLFAELAAVRERGYASNVNELEVGLVSLAAPIFNLHSEVCAAITVAGPSSRITPQKRKDIAERVVASARAISQQLGQEPIEKE